MTTACIHAFGVTRSKQGTTTPISIRRMGGVQ